MLRNGLEPWHLLIVAIVIIVLFGSKKLPDAARAVGTSMRILKSETKAMKEEGEGAAHPAPSAQASSAQTSSAQASSVQAPVAAARPVAPEGADTAR
ncbi:Sec-independent protein translocase subunit TatA [Streptomyces scopuliridis]|uniref:Sec-independent protein translocase subunit TatA n=1 Tax=Streptomyces scopuliridis TaxID=452529 RepID=UPI0035DEB374